MKILGIIPARGGSKGINGKNIKTLAGKPLIQWTIEAALASNLTEVIVSTDSEEIAKTAKALGANVPFIRPSHLSNDTALSIDVVKHAIQFFQETERVFDAVMMLQPTTPFRNHGHINESIDLFLKNSKLIDSVISVTNVQGHHPARMKYISETGILIDPVFAEEIENQPRQELKPMYIRNGAIYLSKCSSIIEGSFKGFRSMGLVMDARYSVNIDDQWDFELAQWLLQNK